MRIAPPGRGPSNLPRRLLLALSLSCATTCTLLAAVGPPGRLPPDVDRVARWLPEDTETLFVARSLTLPEPTRTGPDGAIQATPWRNLAIGLAAEGLLLLDDGEHVKPLRGRKIAVLVSGARNFDVVSKFGSLRSEEASIIVLAEPLGAAAGEWTASLRKRAKAVRTIAGREVFVFPSTTPRDHWARVKPWEGTYLVLLKPDTILCASSDRYLEAILRREDGPAGKRALPDDLPEWEHVDRDAPVWMLRHVPAAGVRCGIVGATAAFAGDGFRVVYVPAPGAEVDRRALDDWWHMARDPLRIGRRPDRTLVLSCSEPCGEKTLWIVWPLGVLPAFERALPEPAGDDAKSGPTRSR